MCCNCVGKTILGGVEVKGKKEGYFGAKRH